jgi:D-alanyl-D-alanine carboxypeptidase
MRFLPLVGILALATGAVSAAAAPPSQGELQRGADNLVARSDLPAVIAVFEQDGVRHIAAAGLADVKRRRAAQPTDRTWVGSITKSFVAVAVMQLVAEGRIGLDDTVEKHLPGWVRQGRRVRIRNLLNHTSGIPNYMEFEPARSAVSRNPRIVIPVRKLIAPALKFNLAFRPGSRAEYSNTNYVLLGEIVQRVTKRPLGRLLRERIFGPLGLRSTTYEPGARRVDAHQLHGYEVGGASPRDVSWNTFGGLMSDGAIVSSARDLAVFFGALIRGRLVTKRLLAKMMTVVPNSHGEGAGLYRLPSPCGRNYWGHTGGTPGYITFAAASRDGRRVVVVAVNGVGTNAIGAMGHFLDDLLCR